MTALLQQDLGSLSTLIREIRDEIAAQVRTELLQVPVNVSAPSVNVEPPTVNVAAPVVHVAGPEVTVEPTITGLAELTAELRTVTGLLRELVVQSKKPVTTELIRGKGNVVTEVIARRG